MSSALTLLCPMMASLLSWLDVGNSICTVYSVGYQVWVIMYGDTIQYTDTHTALIFPAFQTCLPY